MCFGSFWAPKLFLIQQDENKAQEKLVLYLAFNLFHCSYLGFFLNSNLRSFCHERKTIPAIARMNSAVVELY